MATRLPWPDAGARKKKARKRGLEMPFFASQKLGPKEASPDVEGSRA
jgi:hypothetical protein